MPNKRPDFNLRSAHRHFAVTCFNKTWDYINKPRRSQQDKLDMLHNTITSLWHWSQRKDATPTNLSIGHWQVSRVYALLGQADNARQYAKLCLKYSKGIEPVFAGFAYEALARAEMVAGDKKKKQEYFAKAQKVLAKVSDEDDREYLERDLSSIK